VALRELKYGAGAVHAEQRLTAAAVVFLNEEQLLPRMLASLQTADDCVSLEEQVLLP